MNGVPIEAGCDLRAAPPSKRSASVICERLTRYFQSEPAGIVDGKRRDDKIATLAALWPYLETQSRKEINQMKFMKMAGFLAATASVMMIGAGVASAETEGGEPISVCIITSSGIDDGSFNQDCYKGILSFIDEHDDCTVTDIKESDYNELIPTVEKSVGDYDVFVLPGFNFAGIGDIAQNNPDKDFIVVDSTITDSEGNALTLDNVYTMTFKEQEGGFLAGVAAALSTKSDKVAVVNGMPFPSNVNYEL